MAFKDLLKDTFNFSKVFNPLGKSAVGIDIGSSSIKVVELEKRKGKASLKTYGEIALGPYGDSSIGQVVNLSNEKIAEALHDILSEAKTSTTNSGMAIPFRSSLVSLIEMPSLSDKQLEEAIPIEARKYIPVPISEITLDWWIIPKDTTLNERAEANDSGVAVPTKEKSDVMVVSIHNEILSDYNNIVRANNLNTSFFEIEMFSAIRSLVMDEKLSTMVMDVGASGIKLYLVERGVLRNSHIINKGSRDITFGLAKSLGITNQEAEKIKRNIGSLSPADQKTVREMISLTLDGILAETQNFFDSHQHRSGHVVDKIILTGGGVAMAGFPELVQEKFKSEVIVGNPFSKVDTPAFLAETLKTSGLEFGVAVGIALRKIQELD